MNAQEWVKKLVKYQGKETAIAIVNKIVEAQKSDSPPIITLFDEADWIVDHNGKYQYAKIQKFNVGKMEKRMKKTKAFYAEAKGLLKNGKY